MHFDQWKRKVRYGNPWMVIIVLIAMLSALFMFISNLRSKHLEVYNEENEVSPYEYTEEKEDTVGEMYDYQDADFTISIPQDWKKIVENGKTSFIHTPSSSSVELEISDYDPAINSAAESELSKKISEDGYSFVSFRKISSSNYELIYQKLDVNTYDYMDVAFWNQEKIVHLVCCFSDKNYEKILPYYQKILESFTWNDEEKSIPADVGIVYAAPIQFGVPYQWEQAGQDNVYTAYDQESNTNYTFTSAVMNHKEITGNDVANYLNTEGYSNFVMNSYEGNKEQGHAVCSYLQGDIQYIREAYVFAHQGMAYFMIFDYQKGMFDASLAQKCAGFVRFFDDTQASSEEDSPESTTGGNEVPSSETTEGNEIPSNKQSESDGPVTSE